MVLFSDGLLISKAIYCATVRTFGAPQFFRQLEAHNSFLVHEVQPSLRSTHASTAVSPPPLPTPPGS